MKTFSTYFVADHRFTLLQSKSDKSYWKEIYYGLLKNKEYLQLIVFLNCSFIETGQIYQGSIVYNCLDSIFLKNYFYSSLGMESWDRGAFTLTLYICSYSLTFASVSWLFQYWNSIPPLSQDWPSDQRHIICHCCCPLFEMKTKGCIKVCLYNIEMFWMMCYVEESESCPIMWKWSHCCHEADKVIIPCHWNATITAIATYVLH